MNPLGVNAWVWVSPVTDERIAALAPRVAGWGFDHLELPLEQPGDWDPRRTADVLAAHGLRPTVCIAMAPGRDLTTTDRGVVRSTQDYLGAAIDAAAEVGAAVVGGPMYAPTGRTWRLTPDERAATVARVAEALRQVADHAGERGVALGVEPLNRFETSLVNTTKQALELVEQVDHPACGLMLDTFHLNIEEKDPAGAVRAAGAHLVAFQVCGNDRGAPGSDHIDWPAIYGAVGDAGYQGPLVIESFTAENQTIATAASIWRPLERSQDAIATDGLRFLRRLQGR